MLVVLLSLLIAFASYRDRPRHPRVYFYEHDGVGSGKVVGGIDPVNMRSDHQPSLPADGRYCAFASEVENGTSQVLVWDRVEKKLVPDPAKLNDSPNGQLHPSLSGDGRLLAFSAWNRPGVSTRWAGLLYDREAKALVELPGLNRPGLDWRMTALSGDGRWLAGVRQAKGASSDVVLYDLKEKKMADVAGLNSPRLEIEPSLSADGGLIAFTSDRPGGKGGRDVYLWDRAERALIDLPGLNAAGHDHSPSLSPGGRFLAFVSERVTGEGERDVYLYDRKAGKLLPTPGLNAKAEDIDPRVIVVGKEW